MSDFLAGLSFRDFAELAYFITGGPLLALIALLGLRQISISKQDIQINAQRDAYRLAAEQVHFYLTDVIPVLNNLDKSLKENDLLRLADAVQINMTDDKIEIVFSASREMREKFINVAPQVVECLNKMESFSLPFTSGLASEKIAYASIGNTYTNSVKKILWCIAIAGDENYRNVRGLFSIWYKRKKSEGLFKEKMEIEKEISKVGSVEYRRTIGE